jgi:hypothetical protein
MRLASKSNTSLFLLWGILLLELGFIFFVLLNYYFAWISNENDKIHAWVFSNGKQWRWEDWGRFLDNGVIEGYADRISRPVCDFVHIVNAKFRAFCWNYIPPHPSLSILWPFCFVIIPVFLYKFLKNLGCYAVVALAGVSLYLGSIGFLSPVVMYIHPAKVLVNICAVLVLYWGSELSKSKPKSEQGSLWPWFGFLSLIFFSFFCDESGLFIYVMAFFVAAEFMFSHKRRWLLLISFASLPAWYFLTIRVILPYIHFCYNHAVVDLRHYSQYPNMTSMFHAPWWNMFFTNLNFFFHDNPHLQLNTAYVLPNNKPLFFLQLVYTLTAVLVGIVFIKALFKKPLPETASFKECAQKRLLQIAAAFGLAIVFVFFHTVLTNMVWGNWYYGAFFSLIYLIMVSFIFQFILERDHSGLFKRFFPGIVFLFVLHNLAFTFYRVDFFDTSKMVWTQKYSEEDVFMGKIGEYYRDFSLVDGIKKSDCRYWYTVLTWEKAKGKAIDDHVKDKVNGCRETLQKDQAFFVGQPYWAVEL